MAELLFGSRAAAEEIQWRLEQAGSRATIEERGHRFALMFPPAVGPAIWARVRDGKNAQGEKISR